MSDRSALGANVTGQPLSDHSGNVLGPNPYPGTAEARAAGCICPVLDNGHGNVRLALDRGGWITVVGCDVHHLMPDGCKASEQEARCEGCGEFVCMHDCAWYDDIDPDEPGEHGETFVCAACGAYGIANGTLRLHVDASGKERT